MKLVIAGSRTFNLNTTDLWSILIMANLDRRTTTIISGGASGIDTTAIQMAKDYEINYYEYMADWIKYGKAAGPMRNKRMAVEGDELLVVWDGESKGSANMKSEMLLLKKPVHEVILRCYNEKTRSTRNVG